MTAYTEFLRYKMNRLHTEFSLEHNEELLEMTRSCTEFSIYFNRFSPTARWGGGDFSGVNGFSGEAFDSYRLGAFFEVIKRRGHLVYLQGSGLRLWFQVYGIKVSRIGGPFRKIE